MIMPEMDERYHNVKFWQELTGLSRSFASNLL